MSGQDWFPLASGPIWPMLRASPQQPSHLSPAPSPALCPLHALLLPCLCALGGALFSATLTEEFVPGKRLCCPHQDLNFYSSAEEKDSKRFTSGEDIKDSTRNLWGLSTAWTIIYNHLLPLATEVKRPLLSDYWPLGRGKLSCLLPPFKLNLSKEQVVGSPFAVFWKPSHAGHPYRSWVPGWEMVNKPNIL